MDHSKMAMPMPPAPTEAKPAQKKPATKPAPKKAANPAATDPHAGHQMPPATTSEPAAMPMDHSKMDHAMPEPPAEIAPPMDHAGMGHDMAGMSMEAMPGMQHGDMEMAPGEPRTPIPPIIEADRAAAMPPSKHMEHLDNAIHSYTLLNRLEGWNADPGKGQAWEGHGWIGTDLDRLWWRSEGERVDGRTESADLEAVSYTHLDVYKRQWSVRCPSVTRIPRCRIWSDLPSAKCPKAPAAPLRLRVFYRAVNRMGSQAVPVLTPDPLDALMVFPCFPKNSAGRQMAHSSHRAAASCKVWQPVVRRWGWAVSSTYLDVYNRQRWMFASTC